MECTWLRPMPLPGASASVLGRARPFALRGPASPPARPNRSRPARLLSYQPPQRGAAALRGRHPHPVSKSRRAFGWRETAALSALPLCEIAAGVTRRDVCQPRSPSRQLSAVAARFFPRAPACGAVAGSPPRGLARPPPLGAKLPPRCTRKVGLVAGEREGAPPLARFGAARRGRSFATRPRVGPMELLGGAQRRQPLRIGGRACAGRPKSGPGSTPSPLLGDSRIEGGRPVALPSTSA